MLRGERVALLPLTESDVPELVRMLAEPEVARWWGRYDDARVRAELVERGRGYGVLADGKLVGAIEFHEEDDPEYRHASVDLFLDASATGRGLGRDVLRTMLRHLFDDRGHHRITIDPAVDNQRAVRAYEAVGFRPVGVLRRYWLDHEAGEWRDGLLMDLLADEMT